MTLNRHIGTTRKEQHIGIIHLVRTQNFPKHLHFLTPDTHTLVFVSGVKKCKFFRIFYICTK